MNGKRDHEQWVGKHIADAIDSETDWAGAWPIISPDGQVTGIGYADQDLPAYQLADWVDGRAVVRDCASDCLVDIG